MRDFIDRVEPAAERCALLSTGGDARPDDSPVTWRDLARLEDGMRKSRLLASWFAFGLIILLVSSTAAAQQVAVAQLSGRASDQTGAALPDAAVRMTETERGVVHTTTTNSEGAYTFPSLPVGAYKMEVSKSGFKTYVQSGIDGNV